MIYANFGAYAVIASTTYMTTVELFDECPSSHQTMVTIDHDNHIYIQRHNNNGNRKKHQSLLLREISSGPGPSSPLSCFLSWHVYGD